MLLEASKFMREAGAFQGRRKALSRAGVVSAATICFALLFGGQATDAQAQSEQYADMSGRAIMDEVARRHDRPHEFELQTMTLIDGSGNREERQVRRYVRETGDEIYKYLVVFTEPASVSGVALLTWQNDGGGDDQWMLLPARGDNLTRIAEGGRRNYFMGTDFAFEDLSSDDRDGYRFDRQDDETLNDTAHFVIDVYPTNPTIKESTGYEYRRFFVRQDVFFTSRIDFFDRRGRFMKRQTNQNIVQIKDELYRANVTLMDNESEDHQTLVQVTGRSFSEKRVPDVAFTHRFLESGQYMR